MTASYPCSDGASTVVDRFTVEFENSSQASPRATHAAMARVAGNRRRFVDATTCQRDYSTAESEFRRAMQENKLRSGRMFPTRREVLEVLEDLG